jgi:hypothetical protein
MLTGTLGAAGEQVLGRTSPLKDTRRRGGTNQTKLQNCNAFFVALPQRPIRCQREYLSSVSTRGTLHIAFAQSSPDLSVSFLSLPVECSGPTLGHHARAHAHNPLPSLPFHSWPVHQSHPGFEIGSLEAHSPFLASLTQVKILTLPVHRYRPSTICETWGIYKWSPPRI